MSAFFSCGSGGSENGKGKPSGHLIEGKFKTHTGITKVILEEIDASGLKPIDSTQISDDGSFTMRGRPKGGSFYLLRYTGGDVPLYLDSTIKVSLTIDPATPEEYEVKGSPENIGMREVIEIGKNGYKKVNELQKSFQNKEPNDSLEKVFQQMYADIMTARKKELEMYITKNIPSEAGLFAAIFMLPSNGDLPGNVRENYAFFDEMDTKYQPKYKTNKHFVMIHNVVEGIRSTAIGNVMADIILPDTAGKTFKISSLRGKYVLVDFWASWCMPCRAENPSVLKAYKMYHDKGFEVVGVSLDNDKNRWKAAIAKDGLTWTHISELKGWQSSVCQKFNVSSIPFSILLDKDGRILATNLRGEMLDEKLKSIFEQ